MTFSRITNMFSGLAAGAAMLTLAGCQSTFINLTPTQVAQNPSNTYTMRVAAKPSTPDVNLRTMEANLVIDGQVIPMQRIPGAPREFTVDYLLPPPRNTASYYYTVNYTANVGGVPRDRYKQSDLYTLELVNRYVIDIQARRGPVGAEIPVVGRGFSQFDRVVFGGIEAQTTYLSPVALSFTVPALAAGKGYEVELITGAGNLPMGEFQIDASGLRVTPAELVVTTGETSVLLFSLDTDAPRGGLLLDITTDIPSSVIMPEVVVPGGARSVSVPVQGGVPADGHLYVSATGFEELKLPVRVAPKNQPQIVEAAPAQPTAPLQPQEAPVLTPADTAPIEGAQALPIAEEAITIAPQPASASAPVITEAQADAAPSVVQSVADVIEEAFNAITQPLPSPVNE